MIRAVIFDLDGVIRHYDPATVADIERRHGLAPGAIVDAAFAQPLITEVTCGRMTRAAWVAHVGELIAVPRAAAEWGAQSARVDTAMLDFADELRRRGLITAVLTNGTDTVGAEVAKLRIAPHFDAIYNSATIGFAKPDVRAFQHVLDDLGLTGPQTFFTDDSPSKLAGATALGMRTHPFTRITELRRALAQAGVAVTA